MRSSFVRLSAIVLVGFIAFFAIGCGGGQQEVITEESIEYGAMAVYTQTGDVTTITTEAWKDGFPFNLYIPGPVTSGTYNFALVPPQGSSAATGLVFANGTSYAFFDGALTIELKGKAVSGSFNGRMVSVNFNDTLDVPQTTFENLQYVRPESEIK